MRVLVVNAGSSSLKLSLLDGDERLAEHLLERWDGTGVQECVKALLRSHGAVDAVGHRVVHGGPRSRPVRVDAAVVEELAALTPLAPLHQPRAVAALRSLAEMLPEVPAVACFDTAFHASLPAEAATYALPASWNARWGLRRYGFHGLSHAYAVRRAAALVGRDLQGLRVLSCHLGAGASLCAVLDGRSVDTTMGFTPLEGLVMATRSGSIDPGLLLWLLRQAGVGVDELDAVLSRRAGLAGLSGTSGDLRDVLAAAERGDARASLAYSVFLHRLAREAAAMTAASGGLDLLVFTGGIGEHEPAVRSDLTRRLAYLGVLLRDANDEDDAGDRIISTTASPVMAVVVAAREDLQIALETRRALRCLP